MIGEAALSGSVGQDYTVSLFRPFALLRLITFRPFGVLIRTRKPWVRFRLLLLGWYVRFMTSSHCVVKVYFRVTDENSDQYSLWRGSCQAKIADGADEVG